MGIRTTKLAKYTLDTKHISAHGSTPNSLSEGIELKSSQHQVPCIMILSILIKYLEQNVCVCVRVCVRACVRVCDNYFKLYFSDKGGIMLKEALLFFYFILFIFFVFLDCVMCKL